MSHPFNQLIQALSNNLGLNSEINLQDPITLEIDDMPLTIAYDARSGGDDILLYASLGTVAENQELLVYRTMLEGNLMWSATADATLGVNSETREAMIAYRMPIAGLESDGLIHMLAYFSEVARTWRDFISSAGSAGSPSAKELSRALFLKKYGGKENV